MLDGVAAHLYGEGLEAHESKVLYQLTDRHVQCAVARRCGREGVFEVREVLHLGVKVQVEVCVIFVE